MLLKVGDDVSTDEISAAGAQALPFRLNIPKLAELAFTPGEGGGAEAGDGALCRGGRS